MLYYYRNMSEYPSALLVFTAGFLSFFSPCVLPLIPSYLSILGGAGGSVFSTETEQANRKRFILFITTLCFILGFTAVFIILSIIISATFLLMGGVAKYIRIAAGIIVVILGLNIIFDFLTFLNYEKRLHTNKPQGFAGAFLAGAAFGAGWTPCIGPILTGVLFLAGQSGKAGIAALYLALYSLGLGLPFLSAALFFDRFLVSAKWFRSRLPLIKKISGGLLIIMGLLILTGRFSALNIALIKWQYQYIYWAQDKALPFRILADWLNLIQSI
jgi:cytochrome c-type biogenesis protein